ncbi:MAG TPA: type VI secretion system contractile sheath large subunit [Bryobacteraceae bacterium]|nr:type VI secretion system contractile sheath large subunit [Bryobacteraceae bacterium]
MPKPSYAGVVMDVEPNKKRIDATPEPDSPFQVLIMGDFSGRASRGVVEPILGRRPVFVDCDEIDNLPGRLGAHLLLPLAGDHGAELNLSFSELEDFSADRIYEKCDLFPALRAMRRRLENPETLKKTTSEILGGVIEATRPEARASSSIITGSLLDQIADEFEDPTPAKKSKPRDPLLAYVHDLVAPHLVPGQDPKQKELLAELDEEVGRQMRGLLHNPLFQSLEAAWRGLEYVIRNVESDVQLKIYILDVSKAELLADLASTNDLRRTGLFQVLAAATPNGEPWSLLGFDGYFRPWIDDIELLARVGILADFAGAPLLAGADSSVLGVKNPERLGDDEEWVTDNPVWEEIRALPEARRIGLTLPRIILRQPYGKNSNPTERFKFEEMPEGSTHAHYLWGNGMYACLTLICQSFSEDKWDMRPGSFQDLHRLPMHTWKEYGNVECKPCAEVLLTLSAAETMIGLGLIPLLSMKGTDHARVGMFQSIAKPAAPLEGRWS